MSMLVALQGVNTWAYFVQERSADLHLVVP